MKRKELIFWTLKKGEADGKKDCARSVKEKQRTM